MALPDGVMVTVKAIRLVSSRAQRRGFRKDWPGAGRHTHTHPHTEGKLLAKEDMKAQSGKKGVDPRYWTES